MIGKRLFSLLGCCFVVGFSLAGLFIGMIPANAADSSSITLTVSETLALYGDTIDVTYFNGTDYVDSMYTYRDSFSSGPTIADTFFTGGQVWLRYVAPLSGSSVNTNPSYITLHLKPAVSFVGTYEMHEALAIYSFPNWFTSPPYNSSHWEIYQNGVKSLMPFIGDEIDGVFTPSHFSFGGGSDYACCVVDSIYSEPSTVSFGDVYMYGVNRGTYLYIACPTVSSVSSGSSGIVTVPSGGGGSSDYTPLLEDIIAKLDAIAEQNGYTDDEQEDINDTDTSITNQTLTVEQIESGESSLWVSPDSAAIGWWSAGVDAGSFPDMSLSGSYVKQGVTFGDSAFDVRYNALMDDAAERASPAGSFSDFFALLGDFPFFIIGVGLYLFSVILHTG